VIQLPCAVGLAVMALLAGILCQQTFERTAGSKFAYLGRFLVFLLGCGSVAILVALSFLHTEYPTGMLTEHLSLP
jgi:hypothetical protein